jgi:hypothetical protein
MSASLIGCLGSSTFRLSTAAVSMSLTGSCFSSESQKQTSALARANSVSGRPRASDYTASRERINSRRSNTVALHRLWWANRFRCNRHRVRAKDAKSSRNGMPHRRASRAGQSGQAWRLLAYCSSSSCKSCPCPAGKRCRPAASRSGCRAG